MNSKTCFMHAISEYKQRCLTRKVG